MPESPRRRPVPVPAIARRPVFLDLTKIREPVGAVTSIGHRISGVVLALSLPAAIGLFGLSLGSESGFARVMALFDRPGFKVLVVIVVWALAQHLLGGVRHLLSDFEVGSPLRAARRTAWAVNLAGIAVALLAAVAVS